MRQLNFTFFLLSLSICSMAQNVGIGVNNPDERLHVDSIIRIGKNQTLPTIRKNLLKFGDANFLTIGEELTDDKLYIRFGDLAFLRSSNSIGNGYIGINVEQPSTHLDLDGGLRLRGGTPGLGKVLTSDALGNATWQAFSGAGWSLTGNAGTNPATNFLGTTDNQPLMFRQNNMYAGQFNYGLRNYFIGNQAGFKSTGLRNVAIGDSALFDNTSGSVNIAIGSGALHKNTVNSFIVAVGDSALYRNGSEIYDLTESGKRNTAVGSKALFGNSAGHGNTALGFEAGYSMGAGKNNVAIGYRAMSRGSSSEQYECIAIGMFALDSNIDQHNTAVGTYALRNNRQGFNNTAVGHGAMVGNKKGEYNTGLGYSALNANTEGNRNTSIGYGALNTNITGSNNTALGTDADVNSGNLSFSTAIGAQALVAQSNSIVLGAISGINGATVSTNIGIGTPAPLHTVDIQANSAFNGLAQLRLHENAGTYARMKFTNNTTAAYWDVAGSPTSNNTTALLSFYFSGSGLDVLNLKGNGNAVLAGTLTENSDVRLKKNISPMKPTLQRLMRLNAYNYQWIDAARDQSMQIGVLAQEVDGLFPELVKKDEKGILSVNYSGLVPVLINAVKEQQQIITKLEQRLNALELKMKQ